MPIVTLPAHAYEDNLPELLDNLGAADGDQDIALDFQHITFWTPGALVLLLAKIIHWRNHGKNVVFQHSKTCLALRYLQRIDFFSHCGLELEEDFQRRDSRRRLVELRSIGAPASSSVEEISTDIADCIFPDANVEDPEQSGLFDLLQYSVSELATNVRQHARAPGFAMAQYMARTDLIRVAIADTGIGVLQSFARTGSPLWTPQMTDSEAIALALRPKVSSKAHLKTPWGDSVNAGVGLTLLKEFCTMSDGNFFIASGNSACLAEPGPNTPHRWTILRHPVQGTLCALAFTRAQIRNLPELLHQAKEAAGLLPSAKNLAKYIP